MDSANSPEDVLEFYATKNVADNVSKTYLPY